MNHIVALLLHTLLSNGTSLLLLQSCQFITCCWNIIKAQHLYRNRRTCLLHILTTVVQHSTNLTVSSTGHNGITNAESTRLNQYSSYRTTALVQLCLDNNTTSLTLWISLQLLHLSNQQYHFQQIADTNILLGRNLYHNGISAVFLWYQTMLHQLVLNISWISTWLINLVDSNNNRYTSILGMVNSLYSLWHNTIISSNYQNGNICYLSTTSTHSSKCFMTWGIQEDNLLALTLYLICTDVLGNTASLMGGYRGLSNNIQQRCFTVVNMAHYGNNRWTQNQGLWIIHNLWNQSRIYLWWQLLYINSKFAGYQGSCIKINLLIDAGQKTHQHQLLDNLSCGTAHLAGQILDDNSLPYFNVLRAGYFHLWSLLLIILVAVILIAIVLAAKSIVVEIVAAILAITVIATTILAVTIIFFHSVSTLHPVIAVILLLVSVIIMAAAIAVVTVITLRTIAVILWPISYRLLAIILMAIATIVMLMPVVTTLLLAAIMLLLVVTTIMLFTIIPALTIFVIVTLPNTVTIATSLTMIFLLLASLWPLSMTLLWLLSLGRSLWLTIILRLWSCLLCISLL